AEDGFVVGLFDAGAVVLDAVVVEDVGADLGAPAALHGAAGGRGEFFFAAFVFDDLELGHEDAHGLLAVLRLVAEGVGDNLDAGGDVGDAYGGGDLVDVLAAGAGCANEGHDVEVFFGDDEV